MTGYRILLGVIIGAILARFLSVQLWASGVQQHLISFGDWALHANEVIVLVMGILLYFFGSRVHSMVKWIGLGFIAYIVASELTEATVKGFF